VEGAGGDGAERDRLPRAARRDDVRHNEDERDDNSVDNRIRKKCFHVLNKDFDL
jgi:hypothetical protein